MDAITPDVISNELKDKHFNFAVDLGCGFGSYCNILKRHCAYLIGIDISPTKLNFALKHGYDEVVCKDIKEYSIPASADAVFMFYSIEHIQLEHGINLLQKISRKCFIMITTDTKHAPSISNHYSLWSERLLQEQGFKTYLYSRYKLLDAFYGKSILAIRD